MMPHNPQEQRNLSEPQKRAATQRALPEHIVAQLRSAGRQTDTGGQPWKGRNLGEGTSQTHQYYGDDGLTNPDLARVLTSFEADEVDEAAVVEALSEVRIFAPIVAQLSQAHITHDGLVSDKEADMALVSLQAPDGRKALPVFTSVDALTQWHPQARPVAASMRKTALSAVEDDNQLIVVNPGQDLTFVVRRPAVWSLAQGKPWIPSYLNDEVLNELKRLISTQPALVDVQCDVGDGVQARTGTGKILRGGGAGPELAIKLAVLPGLTREQLNMVIQDFQRSLASSDLMSQVVDSVQIKLLSAS